MILLEIYGSLGPQGRLGTGGSVHARLHNSPRATQPDLPTSGPPVTLGQTVSVSLIIPGSLLSP